MKRSVSTIGACVNTLRVVAERYRQAGEREAEVVRRERARSLRAYRKRLLARFGKEGQGVRILYGGSVKPSNAAELMAVANVNGALVGGASLKATDFLAIAAGCA